MFDDVSGETSDVMNIRDVTDTVATIQASGNGSGAVRNPFHSMAIVTGICWIARVHHNTLLCCCSRDRA